MPENGSNQVYFLSSPCTLRIVGVKDPKVLTPTVEQTTIKPCNRTQEAQLGKSLLLMAMIFSHHTNLHSSRRCFPTPPTGHWSQNISEDSTLPLGALPSQAPHSKSSPSFSLHPALCPDLSWSPASANHTVPGTASAWAPVAHLEFPPIFTKSDSDHNPHKVPPSSPSLPEESPKGVFSHWSK